MEALLTSALVVALAEIGDKTMLLAIVLAARFERSWPIIGGIFCATIANHALAAWAGVAVAGLLEGFWFRLLVGIGFLAMAAWTLVPDRFEDAGAKPARHGAFLTTLVAFFLVEIGDKTQVATVALAAQYRDVLLVAAGTTLGMMLANVPAVFLGDALTRAIPLRMVRLVAAAIFLALGLWALYDLILPRQPLPV